MNITDDLVARSNGLLKIQPEINDWTGKSFSMFNTGSVEVETAEFLYAMVRLTKPQRILDTGTHFGVSALYMAQGCLDNKLGQVLTLELDTTYSDAAKPLWVNCGVSQFITQFTGKSLDLEIDEKRYDLILLDTEPQIRFQELLKFMPVLNPGGFVFIHDLHRHMGQVPNDEKGFGYPFGALPEQVQYWVKDEELRPIHFPTPRGFMGFYKPREDDYKWL